MHLPEQSIHRAPLAPDYAFTRRVDELASAPRVELACLDRDWQPGVQDFIGIHIPSGRSLIKLRVSTFCQGTGLVDDERIDFARFSICAASRNRTPVVASSGSNHDWTWGVAKPPAHKGKR